MIVTLGIAVLIAAGCSPSTNDHDASALKGSIKVDGSSTVYPITEAVAEEFASTAPRVRLTVGSSGTGGGFKKFATGETDISNASRPVKPSEIQLMSEASIEFIELPIAYDGLSIVVNKANTWADQLTLGELKKIFLADSPAKTWKDVRPNWPDHAIKIYIPGTDSGTFDYFREVVAGSEGSIRPDVTASEDDNVLVKGIMGDAHAIGFFGCAYYFENKAKLRIVPVVNPTTGNAVEPTPATIESGEYAPFSRPLFIYVNTKAAVRPEVKAFVTFYLEHAGELVPDVGYVKLPDELYRRVAANFQAMKTGSQFHDAEGKPVRGPLAEIYK